MAHSLNKHMLDNLDFAAFLKREVAKPIIRWEAE